MYAALLRLLPSALAVAVAFGLAAPGSISEASAREKPRPAAATKAKAKAGAAKKADAKKAPGRKAEGKKVASDAKKAAAGKKAAGPKKVAKARKGGRKGAAVIAELTKDGKPNVQSQHGIVIDLDTDEVLWARQPDAARPIASVSKLLAATVAVEKGLDLKATQTMSEADERVGRGGAKSRLLRGYVITNGDLLHAALLGSDNRAVSAFGRSVGLDAKAFAAAMTEKAREMGLKHTRFGDPTGLDERNVSSPREVVAMLRYALKNPTLGPILKTAEHSLKYTVGTGKKARSGEVHYNSTNRLLRGSAYKIYGGKTGYTDEAKYCFTVAGEVDHGRRVAMAFLHGAGELTRFADFRRVALFLKKNPPAAIARPASEDEVTEPAGAIPYRDELTAAAAEAALAVGVPETEGGGSDAPDAGSRAAGNAEDAPPR